jgi:spore maturation protein CgeB
MLTTEPNLGLEMTTSIPSAAKLALLGMSGGSHIGESLARGAAELDIRSIRFDSSKAFVGPWLLRSFFWHLADRRPLHLHRFEKELVAACARDKPEILIATGMAPLTGSALRALRQMGVVCVNYSTDDPWNPAMRSRWYVRALPFYDLVFSTRRSNLSDFQRIGCPNVHYLPFGYDDTASLQFEGVPAHDVLFVGGADPDRAAFMTEFMRHGPRVTLVGGYWKSFPGFWAHALGKTSPEVIRALTQAAKVNLCLVRRANRDGHVMRSFEIAAIGGCMLAEDTEEHRAIFGGDGESVHYFRTPKQAAALARLLIDHPAERARLAASARDHVKRGAHTYRDRLRTMLDIARVTG